MNEQHSEHHANGENVPHYKTAFSIRFKGNKKAYTFGTHSDGYVYGDYVVV